MRTLKNTIFVLASVTLIVSCANKAAQPLATTQDNTQRHSQAIQQASATPYNDQDFISVMNHAAIRRMNGDLNGSNLALDRAMGLFEERYTSRISDVAQASFLNPTKAPYKPTRLEAAFTGYLKVLNYNELSSIDNDANEAALVELRRLDILQSEARYRREMGIPAGNNNELADFILGLFSAQKPADANTGIIDVETPWLYALSALFYENDSDFQGARIANDRALKLLDKGSTSTYLHQLIHTNGLRSLRKEGYSDAEIAESPFSTDEDLQYKDNDYWVVLHDGLIPKKSALGIMLTVDVIRQRIILRPIKRGSTLEREQQAEVFAALTASYNSPYKDAIVVELGDNWSTADSLGLTATVGGGVRIFIPYYSKEIDHPNDAFVNIGANHTPITFETIADLKSDLLRYQKKTIAFDFETALFREISKSAGYKSLTGGLSLPFSLGGAITTFTANADLREWPLMPARIRVARVPANQDLSAIDIVQSGKRRTIALPRTTKIISARQF